MTNQLTKREIELEQLIYLDTINKMEQSLFSELGIDAYNLSLDLFSDRANISRTLNNLTREGHLTKLNGRPTLFISKRAILEYYPDLFLPQSLANHDALENYIKKNSTVIPTLQNEFENVIGSKVDGSLYETIRDLKSAISYPEQPLDILLSGDKSCGKQTILNALMKYALNRQIVRHEKDIYSIDCFHFADTAELVPFIKRNTLNAKNRKIFIIYNIEILTAKDISGLNNLIINRTAYNEDTKEHQRINCSFILTTNGGDEFIQKYRFDQLMPMVCTVTSFDEKTIEEKISIILLLFQEEVNKVNRTVKLNKNIINCFVMSHYNGNLLHIKNRIRSALSKALIRTSKFSSLVEIKFEDLSDDLLYNITTDEEQINTLYKIHEYNEISIIYLYPNTECELLTILKSTSSKTVIEKLEEKKTKQALSPNKKAQVLINDSLKITNNTTIINPLNMSEEQMDILNIKNTKLKWGIFNYISELIDKIKNDEYKETYLPLEKNSSCNKSSEILIDMIEETYDIILPKEETQVLNEYISQAYLIENSVKVEICVFTNFTTISDNYQRFAESLKNGSSIHTFSAQELSDLEGNKEDYFANFIASIDSGKGVLVLIEHDMENIYESISSKVTNQTLVIPDLNIHLLEQICREANSEEIFIEEFTKYQFEDEDDAHPSTAINESMISLIEREVLSEALLFLNPEKILKPSADVFNLILIDLNLPYTEIRAVKFIIHVSFMVERIVRGEKLSYKNVSDYVAVNGDTLITVSKRMELISNIFGIKIPQEELIYITDMFLS